MCGVGKSYKAGAMGSLYCGEKHEKHAAPQGKEAKPEAGKKLAVLAKSAYREGKEKGGGGELEDVP